MVNCHSLLTLNITRPHMLILNIISIFKLMQFSHKISDGFTKRAYIRKSIHCLHSDLDDYGFVNNSTIIMITTTLIYVSSLNVAFSKCCRVKTEKKHTFQYQNQMKSMKIKRWMHYCQLKSIPQIFFPNVSTILGHKKSMWPQLVICKMHLYLL